MGKLRTSRRNKTGEVLNGDAKPSHPRRSNKTGDRERERVRGLSRAFSRLRTTLPWVPADTKLSKLDTLKLATSYIAYLVQVLNTESETTVANTEDAVDREQWPSQSRPQLGPPPLSTAATHPAIWPGPLGGLTEGALWGTRRRKKSPEVENHDFAVQRNNRHSGDKKTKKQVSTSFIRTNSEPRPDDNPVIS